MADEHTTENREKRKPERKKLNGRKIADNIMKGAVMLIMAVIFVMLADQFVTTPFFSAEIEGRFSRIGIFGTTLMTIITYILGAFLGALRGIYTVAAGAASDMESDSAHGNRLSDFSTQDLLIGTLGLLFGLIIANLIGLAFSKLPIIGAYGPIVFSIIFGYAGMSIAVRKKTEIAGWVSFSGCRGAGKKSGKGRVFR